MTTQKPLVDMRRELLEDIRSTSTKRGISARLHKIYEESIYEEVKAAIDADVEKLHLRQRLYSRIPDINLIRKMVNKLSKVYNKQAVRKVETGTDRDQELIDYYSSALCIDKKLNVANQLLELNKSCAIEPYMGRDGKPKLRILTNYQCQPYSDDPDDPTSMTVITKFMGQYNVDGEQVEIYHSFSSTEFMIWSEKQVLRNEAHDVGQIPFIWLNDSEFKLVPYAPESDIKSAVMVPKFYADLYYAMNYLHHSVQVAVDLVLPDELEINAGSILDLKTDEESLETGKQGKLSTVEPKVKVKETLELIKQTVADILDTKGIKPPQQNERLERPNAAAAMIEHADASSHIIQRCNYFHGVENQLWDLIRAYHNTYWKAIVENRNTFSDSFLIDIVFGEVKPAEIKGEVLDNIDKQRNMGLMSKRQALQELYPHFTEKQIDAWLEEAEKEAKENEENVPGAQLSDGESETTSGSTDNPDDQESDT